MEPAVKVLLISNAITLLVLLAKIIWDMTRSETRDLTIAVKENTQQIIKLASSMSYVTEELQEIPTLARALNALEKTVALYQQRLEALDRDFREFRKDQKERKGQRAERDLL